MSSSFVLSIDRIKHYHIKLDIVAYSDSSKNEWVNFYGITDPNVAKDLAAAKEIYWYCPNTKGANAVRIIPVYTDLSTCDIPSEFVVCVQYSELYISEIPKIIKKLELK